MVGETLDEKLRALRDIIQVDPGNRGLARDPADSSRLAAAWSPWRSYAQVYLWNTLGPKEN